jgi:hypothetical protein
MFFFILGKINFSEIAKKKYITLFLDYFKLGPQFFIFIYFILNHYFYFYFQFHLLKFDFILFLYQF